MRSIKQWLKSKSINFALLMGALGVMEAYTGDIKMYLEAHNLPGFGIVYSIIFSVGMIYLRSITTTSLKDK